LDAARRGGGRVLRRQRRVIAVDIERAPVLQVPLEEELGGIS
jgi:hypothetical protein